MTSGGEKIYTIYYLICKNEVTAVKGSLKVKLEKMYHQEITVGET